MSPSTQLWENTQENFAGTWNLETPSEFVITASTPPDEMTVTTVGVRGLGSGTFLGLLDPATGSIDLRFDLKANGVVGGKKILIFSSAESGAGNTTWESPQGSSPNDWGSDLEDFEGSWDFPGGGRFHIHQTPFGAGLVQCVSVGGLQDGLYLADFDDQEKRLTLTFSLLNNGHSSGGSTGPKELRFVVPEPLLNPGTGIPTEGERYEEAEGG